jgi:regulator of sigma E protease
MEIYSFFLFVVMIGFLVFIHELGHFAASLLCKVEVEEFGFGLPPRVFTMFTWRGTAFTINALPFGGFVKPRGENDPDLPMGLAAASPWARFTVAIAGPLMNLITGVIAIAILFSQTGLPNTAIVSIGAVEAGSPADQAGIKLGDEIVSINGAAMTSTPQVRETIYAHLDQSIEIVMRRGGREITLTVTPLSSRVNIGAMGVLLEHPVDEVNFFQAIPAGIQETGNFIRTLFALPGRLITGQATPEEGRLMGMYSIYRVIDQALQIDVESRQPEPAPAAPAASPTYNVLSIFVSLTLSFGVFNLLPIPALDGGHIAFAFAELISRRKIPAKFQNVVNGTAFILLLLLMAYVLIMDFVNPVILPLR